MKHFFRTVVGKTILFLVCLISTCALAASIAAVIFFEEYGIYSKRRESFFEEMITDTIVSEWVDMYNYDSYIEADGVRLYDGKTNLLLKVYNEEGKQIAETRDFDEIPSDPSEYLISVELFKYQEDPQIWMLASINRAYRYINGKPYSIYYLREDGLDFETLTITAYFREGFPVKDNYRLMEKLVDAAYGLRTLIIPIGFGLGLFALFSFIGLMSVSGRRRGDEEVHPGLLNVVPFDIMIAAVFVIGGIYAIFIDSLDGERIAIIFLILGVPIFLAILLGCCMSLATRLKSHTLFSGLLIAIACRFIWKILRSAVKQIGKFFRLIGRLIMEAPSSWKMLIVIGADSLFNFFLIFLAYFRAEVGATVFLTIKTLVILAAAVYCSIKMKDLQKGAWALAGGDLSYKIDTTGMLPQMKMHGDALNSISDGMLNAVEQRMKSERMKTELITNVSHDIKTPLTSIINYVGLIVNEDCDNPKHAEYCEVLIRQSEKLKKLINDLVEASKASTGNLEVHPVPCDAGIFLSQAAGEYEERLKEAGLSLIVRQPEENLRIMADGRHMWRIFDNLMNNILKYSLTGSRVYLSLDRDGDTARFLFKNTSRDVLDISEEELMERFVRGDSSRNTEGNGLGLSIAKSLAQLQNGWLKIETDGDLFKAILTFPLIAEEYDNTWVQEQQKQPEAERVYENMADTTLTAAELPAFDTIEMPASDMAVMPVSDTAEKPVLKMAENNMSSHCEAESTHKEEYKGSAETDMLSL